MKSTSLFIIAVILMFYPRAAKAQQAPDPKSTSGFCLDETERLLAKLINEYRASKGLPAVPLSASLSKVAQIHSKDLNGHHEYEGRCNLHSWSADGSWTSCCYTPDHRRASCMWDKPRELTAYPGDGFEIAYYNSRPPEDPMAYAKDIINGWKGSHGHNEVMVNLGTWNDVSWKAMGIGIYKGYATVWFGEVPDPTGNPDICE
ncbi:MAG: CAP domain-containing protein [Bacteroidales bacterium]|nr:CAP domain-containing protein [Bacteroidales bacterium]